MFGNWGEICRRINLINIDGSCTTTQQPGRFNTASHQSVLKVLEHRATRNQVQGRLAEAEGRSHSLTLDDTGTINTTPLQSHKEIQQQEQIDIRGISDEVLQIHGVLPGCKEEGITRLLYENANGIHNRLGGNDTLEKAKDIINKLSADVVAYNKHCQNLRHKDKEKLLENPH
jgi:hypothetical protein